MSSAGHRHAQRHLLAGRAAVRAADRQHAVRARSGCEQAGMRRDAADHPRGGAAEAEHAAEHRREALPTMSANRGTRAGEADEAGPRRAGLDRDEGAGEGPQPPLRDGQRLRGGRAALPERRAGAGVPAVGGLSAAEVRAAEQGAGAGGLAGGAGAGGRHHRHDLGHAPRHRRGGRRRGRGETEGGSRWRRPSRASGTPRTSLWLSL